MKHVQSNRASTITARAATEKAHVALVVTPTGVHSDVHVMTIGEAEALAESITDAVKAAKKKPAK